MTPAEALARRLHADQRDKAGDPYVGHLERVVANLLRRWPDASEDEIAAAWLHDALEDVEVEIGSLAAWGISLKSLSLMGWLTRVSDEPYASYIADLAERAPLPAIRIKLADLEDNMDPARVAAAGTERLVAERYVPARERLERALGERCHGK